MLTTTTTSTRARRGFRVISFGYGHASAPSAHLTIDVRLWFRDPHVSPELRKMTGANQEVVAAVLGTEGVDAAIDRLLNVSAVFVELDEGTAENEFVLAIGCVGGRHRSQVIADQLVWRARSRGWSAHVQHRDAGQDVLTGARRR